MKLIVFGASGRTGRKILQQALAAGHQVAAVVRNPRAFATTQGFDAARLHVVHADVMQPEDLQPHIHGSDAVLSVLGAGGIPTCPTTVCSDAIHSIITAMQATGVSRLIAMSAVDFGNATADGVLLHYMARPLVLAFLHGSLCDLRRMEHRIVTSGLNWTIVRAPQLLNTSGGTYRMEIGSLLPKALFARRANVATCILHCLRDHATSQQVVSVAI